MQRRDQSRNQKGHSKSISALWEKKYLKDPIHLYPSGDQNKVSKLKASQEPPEEITNTMVSRRVVDLMDKK